MFEWAWKTSGAAGRLLARRREGLRAVVSRERWTKKSPAAADVPLRVRSCPTAGSRWRRTARCRGMSELRVEEQAIAYANADEAEEQQQQQAEEQQHEQQEQHPQDEKQEEQQVERCAAGAGGGGGGRGPRPWAALEKELDDSPDATPAASPRRELRTAETTRMARGQAGGGSGGGIRQP